MEDENKHDHDFKVHVYKVNDQPGRTIYNYRTREVAMIAANVFFFSSDVYKCYVFFKKKKLIEVI